MRSGTSVTGRHKEEGKRLLEEKFLDKVPLHQKNPPVGTQMVVGVGFALVVLQRRGGPE